MTPDQVMRLSSNDVLNGLYDGSVHREKDRLRSAIRKDKNPNSASAFFVAILTSLFAFLIFYVFENYFPRSDELIEEAVLGTITIVGAASSFIILKVGASSTDRKKLKHELREVERAIKHINQIVQSLNSLDQITHRALAGHHITNHQIARTNEYNALIAERENIIGSLNTLSKPLKRGGYERTLNADLDLVNMKLSQFRSNELIDVKALKARFQVDMYGKPIP